MAIVEAVSQTISTNAFMYLQAARQAVAVLADLSPFARIGPPRKVLTMGTGAGRVLHQGFVSGERAGAQPHKMPHTRWLWC